MPLSRWSSRHKKTFGKKKEKWDGNFRLPPKPDSYYTQTKGHCRWCSKVILKGRRNHKYKKKLARRLCY